MNQMVQMTWVDVGALDDVPRQGACRVDTPSGPVAVFRTIDDAVFALVDRCPHQQGPLSEGIVHGAAVACPLHNWVIDLASGEPTGADAGKGCAPPVPVKVRDGRILLSLAG
jgi:nitrite reductase (NADH) small subunit